MKTYSGLQAARVAWIILAALALVILISALPGYTARIASDLPGHVPLAEKASASMAFQVAINAASIFSAGLSYWLAFLLFRRNFENPAIAMGAYFLLLYSVVMSGALETWGRYWVGTDRFVIDLQTALLGVPTVALLAIFPNGKLTPPWTRWLLLVSVIWMVIALVMPHLVDIANPIALSFLAFPWLALVGSAFYAQVVRFRRYSKPDERKQTKWVLFGFALWVGYTSISTVPYLYLVSLPPGVPFPWWAPISELGWWLSMNIIPVTLVIAILRSRLWDIDIVINRTLVYGALSLATMALYIFVVGAFGNLLRVGDSTLIAFLATGLVAVLFQPLRARLQRSVNRLMYGERDDPVSVLAQLGEQVERNGSPEAALSGIVETVARMLKLPYVAIDLGSKGEMMISYGLPRQEVLELPLVYHTEKVGRLLVAPRSPSEPFSSIDMQLLENIAHQAGAAAQAAKLTADLRLSRQRLVTAREEERRRLRRDLHDGIGPSLASLTLKMDAARNLLESNPRKAEQLLDELKKQTQRSIQDIRELVYELRPPALDEFGLVGAIQNYVDSLTIQSPTIVLDIPEPLPPLPAALEVAVYRIALEGVTNVLRHAQACRAVVGIYLSGQQLVVEIRDDGVGLPDEYTWGVGLASIQERVEELGGVMNILKTVGGLHLRASLPLLED